MQSARRSMGASFPRGPASDRRKSPHCSDGRTGGLRPRELSGFPPPHDVPDLVCSPWRSSRTPHQCRPPLLIGSPLACLVDPRSGRYGPPMSPDSAGEISVVRRDQLQAGVTSGGMTRAAAISADTVGSEQIFMGISRLPPGLRSSAHIHTNCESALYVASGKGRFLVGPRVDRAIPIEPGDCIHMPPNAPHVVVNDG